MANEQERIKKALEVIERYGSIDGAHHKMWTLDQVVRALLGSDEAYEAWVKEFQGEWDEEWECYEYEWDVGIPP